MNKKIVLLAGQGESTSILYNSICRNNNIVNVIVENPVPMHKFLYRRVKKLGVFTVLGQVLFVTFVSRILKMTSKKLTSKSLASYDVVIISTDHSDYDYSWIVKNAKLVVDTRNATSKIKTNRSKIVKA